jgi:DNA-directed RNA polymerase alpha subunit
MRSKKELTGNIDNSMMLESQLKLMNEILLDIREILLSQKTSDLPKVDPEIPDVFDTSVFDLKLSARLRGCLLSGNIATLKDISQLSALQLRRLRGIGTGCIKELKEAVAPYGIHIAGN